jgi:hypothetical protein
LSGNMLVQCCEPMGVGVNAINLVPTSEFGRLSS